MHLADYGGPYSGSFIPMLRTAAEAVRGRGWRFDCVFSSVARGRPWLDLLAQDAIEPTFAPDGLDRGGLEGWIEQQFDPGDGPMLLHTHFTRFDLPAAALARRSDGAAAIWHLHSYLPSGPVPVLRTALKFRVLRRGAWIICVSDTIADGVRRRGGAAQRIKVLQNAIDASRFALVSDDERAAARAALGLEPSDQALIHFAWDWEVKGGPLFSETIARLRSNGVPAVGLSIGGGEHVAAASEQLGLGDALRAVSPTDDVRSLYAAADAMVAASAAEGAPLAMLEALSCGLGIAATAIPGHRIAGGPAALRIGGLSADELAEAAGATLGRPEAARSAEAAEAHAWVLQNRDLRGWGAELLSFYDEVLRSSGNATAISSGGSS